jgi:hypothetical protein
MNLLHFHAITATIHMPTMRDPHPILTKIMEAEIKDVKVQHERLLRATPPGIPIADSVEHIPTATEEIKPQNGWTTVIHGILLQ